MLGMDRDGLQLLLDLKFAKNAVIENTLGPEMEGRSFLLARSLLSDEKEYQNAITDIEFKTRGFVKWLQNIENKLERILETDSGHGVKQIFFAFVKSLVKTIKDHSVKTTIKTRDEWSYYVNTPAVL